MNGKNIMNGESELTLGSFYELYELILAAIGRGEFAHADTLLKKLLHKNLENQQLFEIMKGLKFWNYRLDKLLAAEIGLSRAQLLEQYWTQFEHFVEKFTLQLGKSLKYFKQGVFQKIIECYNIELEKSDYSNVDCLLNIALHFRALSDYPKALETLIYAAKLSPNEDKIKLLIADTQYLLGNKPYALSLFRHHFFTMQSSFHKVMQQTLQGERNLLELPTFWELVLIMRSNGFINNELASWLPVYAVLEGLFSFNTLYPFHQTLAVIPLDKVLKCTWERELAFRQNKQKAHLLEGELVYSYLYTLDEITLTVLTENNPPAHPPNSTPSQNTFYDTINYNNPHNLQNPATHQEKTKHKTKHDTLNSNKPPSPLHQNDTPLTSNHPLEHPPSQFSISQNPAISTAHFKQRLSMFAKNQNFTLHSILAEAPLLLKNLKALIPQFYNRLEYRYAHFN
ncbi:hypothetical protein COTS27_00765 [Spirochaetota bacterium]|nr:hypothetical protein COTS27_00765 [Spirochaetota bacterium]